MYGATSGEVDISKIDGAINQAILCIRPNTINKYYLKHLLEFNKDLIISTYIQGGQGNLSAEIIKNLIFKFPSIYLQTEFVFQMNKLDLKINQNIQILDNYHKYKKGLLQQLFI